MAAIALLLGVGATASAQADPDPSCTTGASGAVSPTPPPQDPFYTPPSPIPAGTPGTVIRSRPVCIGDLQVPVPYKAWDVMYLSTGSENAQGQPSDYHAAPSVDTALIVEPLTSGPHPLVAWATAEDSDSTLKAPSYVMAQGSSGDNASWQWALGNGWDVVVPDYEGPGSAYSAGPLEGHGMLDGIRAAEDFSAQDGLEGTATQVGLWGYSGGAMATEWASELAPAYAPQLDIVGVAEGGIVADVTDTFDTIDHGYLAPGLAFGSALGDNAAYPNLVPLSLLNAAGQALAANMRATGNTSYASGAPAHMAGYTECGCSPTDLPRQFPSVAELARVVNPGQHVPKAPLFMYHDYNDELIPIQGVQRLVQYYCSGGATVDFRVNIGDEHVSNAVVGAPEALAYLTARFEGVPAPNTCGLPGNGGVAPPSSVPVVSIPPSPVSTTSSLASSQNPAPAGDSVTYTATVSPSDGNGTVNFIDGTAQIPGCGARPLDSSGQATCTVSGGYPAGQRLIAANYSGDSDALAPSTSNTITETVGHHRGARRAGG